MILKRLIDAAQKFLDGAANFVSPEDALRPELAGMRIYDYPLFGAASADDPLFEELRRPDVVHPEVMLPRDWVSEAMSVVSFFLPFSERVVRSNAGGSQPSNEWLHARIEGQAAMSGLGALLKITLEEAGYEAAFPTSDTRFKMLAPYASNWSERHAAYICGLGTFGASKGLITERGVAGRFGSIITSAEIPTTPRKYSAPFNYCTLCGACEKLCPAKAIDMSRGAALAKDQKLCDAYVSATRHPPHGPNARVRYGCGKCQAGVPCSRSIPCGAKRA